MLQMDLSQLGHLSVEYRLENTSSGVFSVRTEGEAFEIGCGGGEVSVDWCGRVLPEVCDDMQLGETRDVVEEGLEGFKTDFSVFGTEENG
jgi:hypothetical protein